MEVNKMETLKDIKEVLSKIPDEDLEMFMFGCGEESDGEIGLVCLSSGEDGEDDFNVMWDKYPELSKLNKLIENIKKAQGILDKQDSKAEILEEELCQKGITDTYFDKKKNKDVDSSKD